MGNSTQIQKLSMIMVLLLLSIQNVSSAPIDNLHTRITGIDYISIPEENTTVYKININSQLQ